MKTLFPLKQVMGYLFSLILTAVALLTYVLDLSFTTAMTLLLVTAFAQAALQLIVFMHAGETKDRGAIYAAVYYGLIIALVSIFGTLLILVWDMA